MKMRKLFAILWLSTFLLAEDIHRPQLQQKSAVTFILNGGRLGDNLLNFWRARLFAFKNNLLFLCPHFNYIEKFNLNRLEKTYHPELNQRFKKTVRLQTDTISVSPYNTLYKIDFYFNRNKYGMGFDDPKFMQLMKILISPATPINYIKKSNNRLNVALHVRYGSGYDKKFNLAQKKHPLKFPPFQYYIDALHKLIELTGKQPLEIYLFTDAKNPAFIAKFFKKKFENYDVIIHYNKNNREAHTKNVIHDLFNMAKFEYFIRPGSGLSQIAHYIGDHKLVIAPAQPIWKNKKLTIGKLIVTDKRKIN